MRSIWIIAHNDLRLFLREKAHYFWLFGSPLLFAFFMGMAIRGPGSPANPRPQIQVENRDGGFMGQLFTEHLVRQGVNITTNIDAGVERVLRIPPQFTSNILSKTQVKLELVQPSGGRAEAKSLVELKAFRALVAFNAQLIEQAGTGEPLSDEALRGLLDKPNPVELRATWAARKPVPAGYQQSLPGVMTMFIMMNLLIFGGATLASERREGVLRRLLVMRLSMRELVLGKIAGLILLGLVQIAVMLMAGKFFMKIDFGGTLPLLLLTLVIYCFAAAALGLLIGSVLSEDKVVAVCVLASMAMAALGGCWWPLEIVPDHVRTLGHLFPTAWSMDALHQLLSFGGGFAQIALPLLVLTGFGVGATVLSMRYFRA